jgi:UDP-glucose 4-epimerase
MSNVLVTGGAGFIGSHLVDALLARGDHVRVFDNFSTGNRANLDTNHPRLEIVEGDLTDPQAIAQAVDGIELVFHQAALSSVPRSVDRPLDTHAAW